MVEVILYLSKDLKSLKLAGLIDYLVKEARKAGHYREGRWLKKGEEVPEAVLSILERVSKSVYGPVRKGFSDEELALHGVDVREFAITLPNKELKFKIYSSEEDKLKKFFQLAGVPVMALGGRIIESVVEIEEALRGLATAVQEKAVEAPPPPHLQKTPIRVGAFSVIAEKIRRLEQLYREGKISEEKYKKMREALESLR